MYEVNVDVVNTAVRLAAMLLGPGVDDDGMNVPSGKGIKDVS
jgi:hypothetical protein